MSVERASPILDWTIVVLGLCSSEIPITINCTRGTQGVVQFLPLTDHLYQGPSHWVPPHIPSPTQCLPCEPSLSLHSTKASPVSQGEQGLTSVLCVAASPPREFISQKQVTSTLASTSESTIHNNNNNNKILVNSPPDRAPSRSRTWRAAADRTLPPH